MIINGDVKYSVMLVPLVEGLYCDCELHSQMLLWTCAACLPIKTFH